MTPSQSASPLGGEELVERAAQVAFDLRWSPMKTWANATNDEKAEERAVVASIIALAQQAERRKLAGYWSAECKTARAAGQGDVAWAYAQVAAHIRAAPPQEEP